MSTQNFKAAIEEAAKRIGIDMIGFASKARFEGVDPQHNPFSIFPEGKTVIMLGKRICRGALRGVEEGTNFGDYSLFGKNWLEDEFLSLARYDLVRFLEDNGWEACPLFPNPSELGPQGVSVADGRPAPNVYPDFDYAAVAAGLGEIGLNGLFLSPKFGSRQRFHMIITDCEIEETPLFEGQICDGCGKCAAACPLGAIDTENTVEIDICGAKGCIRACMNALEKTNRIENTFHNPFYYKKSWTLSNQPETVSDGVNPYREEFLDENYPGIRANEYKKTED